MDIDLIYCAGGNPRLTQIAHEENFLLGVRSDLYQTEGYTNTFIDIDYKKPNFEKHLDRVAKERPKYATVPDLSDKEFNLSDVERALLQAERLKPHCEIVLLVPKLKAQLALIPPEYAIAYSIPSSYGGAKFTVAELRDRKVHLLGGSPHQQMRLYRLINQTYGGKVISADGNMGQKMAVQFLKYWSAGKWVRWPNSEKDQYFECWRATCQNIYKGWKTLTSGENDVLDFEIA